MNKEVHLILPLKPARKTVHLDDLAVVELTHTAGASDPEEAALELAVTEFAGGALHVLLDPAGDLNGYYRISVRMPSSGKFQHEAGLGGAVYRRLRSGYTEDQRWQPASEGVMSMLGRGSTRVLLKIPLRSLMPEDARALRPVLLRGNLVFEPSDAAGASPAGLFHEAGAAKPLHPENFGLLELSDAE
jgi:hypothetical protein